MTKRTIPALFDETVSRCGSNTFFWEKETTHYIPSSYLETQTRARCLAASLKDLGIKKGDTVALLSQARKDWVISELAIMYIGAVNVPLSTKLETTDLVFRLNHSSSKILFVSEYQYSKLITERIAMPNLKQVIFLDPPKSYAETEFCIDDLVVKGAKLLQENPLFIDKETESVDENDAGIISYTSGTSTDPKGVVLTHKNLWVNSNQCAAYFPLTQETVSLLILPLDHSFAHTALMYTVMKCGASLASVQFGKSPAEALRNVSINMKETRPHLVITVPALTKNFKKNIEAGIKSKGKIVETLFNLGIFFGTYYHGLGYNRGRGLRMLSWVPYTIIKSVVFNKIKENFGGRLAYFVGGGAYLDVDLQKFFFAIGIPVYQGYGLTEASPAISANTAASHKIGSSGKVMIDQEVKICDDKGNTLPLFAKGEIVVRGENVMKEYYLNPTTTTETIVDGWLHTGDMGYLDADNFLYVLGRFKSLLIGNDGEKYSPEGIESMLVEKSPFIDQIMLYNNQCAYTTAIVVPNKEAIKRWIKQHKHQVEKQGAEAAIIALIESNINDYKQGGKYHGEFPDRWLPTTFAIITEPFTEDNKMINSTLKMVRNKIVEAHKERLDFMYSGEGKPVQNIKNREAIEKLLR